jgi:nitroimidazol reductase NimA-like FMN-containing flavoprotein (pyridoxamine 5'-phosphate oxidase superfamily)
MRSDGAIAVAMAHAMAPPRTSRRRVDGADAAVVGVRASPGAGLMSCAARGGAVTLAIMSTETTSQPGEGQPRGPEPGAPESGTRESGTSGAGGVPGSSRPLSSTPRTKLRRLRERGKADRADLYAVLDAGLICHLGVVAGGVPVVLPTAYGRDGDTLYMHGSSANGAFADAAGHRVCVTVTHVDGLVCARSVFHHSVNYRSAVVFGTATLVQDEETRMHGLEVVTEHLIPGRWEAARRPTKKEMAATAVLSLPLDEASVKVRSGGVSDDAEDYDLDVWAGVLPIATTFGEPEPDPLLRQGFPPPAHIRERVSGR